MDSDPIRFDDVIPRAREIAKEIASTGLGVVMVRDVLGRMTLVLDDQEQEVDPDALAEWQRLASDRFGPYKAERPVVVASSLFMAAELLGRALPEPIDQNIAGHGKIRRIENTIVGQDWARVRPQSPDPSGSFRVALYGFKGGVGRSTATGMLARYLADSGRCVLVVDLDLESPGVGPMLVAGDELPRYGLIDQMVESAVENSDGLDLVVRASKFSARGNGELWVAPARGAGNGDGNYTYVSKLNRVYGELSGGSTFADRLESAVTACEDSIADRSRRPDVVLLDSRAGLHDLAAVTISKLSDLALLFGADNSQTWDGYQDLFRYWQECGQAQSVREKIKMVAAMVPDRPGMSKDHYLDSFVDRSWSCFSILYDNLPDGDSVGFNPSPEDITGPHFPIPILFTQELVGIDAVSTDLADIGFVGTAYAEFLRDAGNLVTGGTV
ncbi:KGGVGR-motif variant AAA ATPase [Nocardia sp. BMG111209]|uniref:KGGVGR-motif variant AAA ATPase n=1 Tax=Nocardia sp. BMG111209 TaxID=1160137 RepID=UPI0006910294|nr:AAA family ATPase [Nocardia sp. BMG111209]